MKIKGKVHCFFEQSGTFKNEFIKLGIPAMDYDIMNEYAETDNVIDLFSQIEKAFEALTTDNRHYFRFRKFLSRFNNCFFPLHLFLRG